MKNILLLLLITCSALNACKKENDAEDMTTNNHKTNYSSSTLTRVYFRGINKVLIMGNSLTVHGYYPEIGWYRTCGMAASSEENDYVHLLSDKIHEVNPQTIIKYGRIGNFESNFWNCDTTFFTDNILFRPDLVIIQIGENIEDEKANSLRLRNHIVELVYRIRKNEHVIICLTNCFWPNKYVTGEIEAACSMGNYLLVNIADLYADRSNTASGLFSHQGVANHPGDKGMKMIADRIWSTIASASYPVEPSPENSAANVSVKFSE